MTGFEDINPLIPAEYDVLWTLVVVAAFTVLVVGIALAVRLLAKRR